MAKKVLNIECGRSIVRVAEVLADKKSVKVLNSFMFDSPADLFDGHRTNEFPLVLKRELSARNIKTNKVVFAVNSSRIATREVVIPNIKENRIKDLILSNASDYFPVDLNEYILVHEVIEKFTEGASKKMKVSLLAIPADIIEFYEGLARDCGLTLDGMDYTGNGVRELMSKTAPAGVKASIKMDGYSSLITIMRGNKIELQRHLDYGVHDVAECVMHSGLFGNPSFMQSLSVLKKEKLVATTMPHAEQEAYMDVMDLEYEDNPLSRLRNEVTEQVRALAGSYSRIMDYYHSRNDGARIERIDLLGLGAYINGITEFITNDLGIMTQVMTPGTGVVMGKNAGDAEFFPAEFLSCIGISFGHVSKITEERNKKKKGSKSLPARAGEKTKSSGGDGSVTVAVLIFALCLLVSAVLFGFAFLDNNKVMTEKEEYVKKSNDLAYINEIKEKQEKAVEKNSEAMVLALFSNTRNNNLKQFIRDLEQKMPSDFRVTNFDANDRGVNLTIKVESKASAADVIMNLREFEGIQIGNVSTIADSTLENNEGVNFTIELIYGSILKDAGEQKAETDTGSEAGTENQGEGN